MPRTRAHSVQWDRHDIDRYKTAYFRIVVLGAAGVGKSCIVSQFLYDEFQSEYKETIEELHRGVYNVGDIHLTLDILDTSGAHAFPAMRKLAISTSNAFVLVYSVDDSCSFDEIKRLRDQIIAEKDDENVPILIVGNKADIAKPQRAISKETVETLVSVEWGNGYVEASAKENNNIFGIFKEILRLSDFHVPISPTVQRRRMSTPAVPVQNKVRITRKRHSCTIS